MKAAINLLFLLMALLTLTSPTVSAPAPPPRTQPPPNISPGVYVLSWGGSEWTMILDRSGGYTCELGPTRYVGSWSWCAWKRVLTVTEELDGGGGVCWSTWEVAFGGKLVGRSVRHGVEVKVRKGVFRQ